MGCPFYLGIDTALILRFLLNAKAKIEQLA